MKELSLMINSIQRSNMKTDDRAFCCTAVQEYYKVLEAAEAIKPKKKAPVVKKVADKPKAEGVKKDDKQGK